MTLVQIFILSLIQGITEFLPVSSSAHLVLIPHFLHWPDQGAALDVAVHVGTLGSVMVYFWRDIVEITRGFFRAICGVMTPSGRLAFALIIGTIPAVIVGYGLSKWGMEHLRSPRIIGITSIVYGVLLYAIDKKSPKGRALESLTFWDSIRLGLAQALALIPGTSRSGILITAGRYLGFNRDSAARFAFLLSIPVIIGAASRMVYQMMSVGQGHTIITADIGYAILFSFIAGLLAIRLMMAYIKRGSFAPFALYRVVLGGGVLYLFW